MILSWIWNHKLNLLLAAAVLYLAAARFTSDRAHAKEAAAREEQFKTLATKLGAAVAQEKSAHDIAASLGEKNKTLVAELQKKVPQAKVVQHTTDTVTIHDQVPVTQPAPTVWEDREGRFHLDMEAGVLTRNQKFRLDGVIVQGPDGVKDIRGVEFTEISPRTGQEIDGSGAQIETNFQIVKETPAVPMFHPRALAVIGSGGYGAGVQLLNLKDRFNLDAVALYAPGPHSARIGPVVAWRVKLPFLDTNLGIGPSYLYDVKAGTWNFGAVATIELTR